MTELATGAQQFAEALFGGQSIEDKARIKQQMLYDQQDSGRAELDRKITQAMLERDKRRGQQAAPAALSRTLNVDEQAGMDLANFMLGGYGDLADIQKFHLRNAAKAGLDTMGLAPGNAALAALDGKPLKHTDIDSGHVVVGQYGQSPVIDTTLLEDAKIAAQEALAGQRNASARLSGVKADAGGFKPGGGAGTGVARTDNPDGTVTYATTGNDQVSRARKVIEDLIASGGDPTGHSVDSVRRDMARDGTVSFEDTPAGSIRFITADAVRNVPIPGFVPQAAPAADPRAAVPPPERRVIGQVYPTPKGPMAWTAAGWIPAP